MPSAHAKLSPSAAERWISCTASIRMAEKVVRDDNDSPYAMEGTMAHELAEIRAGEYFGLRDSVETVRAMSAWYAKFDQLYGQDNARLDEMSQTAEAYSALLRERLDQYPGSVLMLEQRLDTGVERCWGTGDAVIVSPDHVEVVDLKYGQGVHVSAYENPQLKLYGVGALDTYGDLLGDVQTVGLTIFQPRIDNTSTWVLPAAQLRAWRDYIVRPAGEEALSDNGRFAPSEKACRWCPAAGICRPRMEYVCAVDFDDEPETLSPEELAEILPKLPMIKSWAGAVEKSAIERVYEHGEKIPGYKMVLSGGRRTIPDQTLAIQTLTDAGYPADKTATFSLKPFGVLEKLVGKKEFSELLGDQISKTPGKVSLVPETDKRAEATREGSAASDFADD